MFCYTLKILDNDQWQIPKGKNEQDIKNISNATTNINNNPSFGSN